MSTTDCLIDGTIPLSEQQTRLCYFQNTDGSHLMNYACATQGLLGDSDSTCLNRATFQELPLGTAVQDVELVEAPEPGAPMMIADQMSRGYLLVCVSSVYVEGCVKTVCVFRKSA